MGHDAFTHHGLGSSALMIIGALHMRSGQSIEELVGSSSVSRATAYRTLRRLSRHGLVHQTDQTWALTPRALEGIGVPTRASQSTSGRAPALDWNALADDYGTAGTAAQRRALHAAERTVYHQALERLTEHRSKAVVIVRDSRTVLAPAPRADEIPAPWRSPDGSVLDPATGHPAPDWRVATDGRLILITPADQRSYDELAAAHAQALSEWESAA
ncbi:helix-turn-helix domain-containing protein [Streptomyces tauricus]|uniref:helix-turn-helix domain-containing protein n=1 Tax=Streptomyces tauricus TaxID=68274 RepID=UPI00343BA263